jgi:hypothetical protein
MLEHAVKSGIRGQIRQIEESRRNELANKTDNLLPLSPTRFQWNRISVTRGTVSTCLIFRLASFSATIDILLTAIKAVPSIGIAESKLIRRGVSRCTVNRACLGLVRRNFNYCFVHICYDARLMHRRAPASVYS